MSDDLLGILADAKRLAKRYREATGRPLGVTGEVAEYEATRILNLELADVRQVGYDAVRRSDGRVDRLQIKGRCVRTNSKPGQRIGSIRIDTEWDAVLLVLLNEDLEATAIYEARRADVVQALTAPGSRARKRARRPVREQVQVNRTPYLA